MISSNNHRAILAGAMLLSTLSSCAPQRTFRTPVPPSSSSAPVPRATPAPVAPPPPLALPEAARNPLPQEAKIREQDIRAKVPPAKEPTRQASVSESRSATETTPAPLTDDSSLLAKITPSTLPQRAASLRLTEEGRKILDAGDPAKALTRLEKTIVIDSTNPYGYFYLAKAQNRLGRFRESLNFLDIAESRLGAEPFWLAEIYALRGDNLRAQGQLQKAEASYNQAVRLNSGNRSASDALARIQADSQSAQPATK